MHPSSEEYELGNKSYWHTLGNGEDCWDSFWRNFSRSYSKQLDFLIPWIIKKKSVFLHLCVIRIHEDSNGSVKNGHVLWPTPTLVRPVLRKSNSQKSTS